MKGDKFKGSFRGILEKWLFFYWVLDKGFGFFWVAGDWKRREVGFILLFCVYRFYKLSFLVFRDSV